MNATEQFIYLTACASAKRQASLETADFDKLWQMAQGHNLTALVAKALQGTEAFRAADAQEQKRWSSVLDNNIKKTMLFEAERRAIERYFEQNGMWYMPLKGVIINPLFPH
ncbi:MAG: nucleotidyltransferase family protein, partial [Ruminococcus sp.]|nr:nucleotidyltransferase family protein [Ruminococcus sp.]